MENIFFDVDQLAPPNRTEQAQCLEEAECRDPMMYIVLPPMIQPH